MVFFSKSFLLRIVRGSMLTLSISSKTCLPLSLLIFWVNFMQSRSILGLSITEYSLSRAASVYSASIVNLRPHQSPDLSGWNYLALLSLLFYLIRENHLTKLFLRRMELHRQWMGFFGQSLRSLLSTEVDCHVYQFPVCDLLNIDMARILYYRSIPAWSRYCILFSLNY